MHIEDLQYQPNSMALFNRFAHQPYAMILDSCHDLGTQGQYDVIVADPLWTITTNEQSSYWQQGATQTPLTQSLFAELKSRLPQQDCSNIPQQLPFATGLMGYFAYDLGYPLNKVLRTTLANTAIPQAVIGYYDWCIIVDHKQQRAYLISQEAPESARFKTIQQLLQQIPDKHQPYQLNTEFKSNLSKVDYLRAFQQIKTHIRNGDCYQVNLSQRFHAEFSGSPWLAYQNIRKKSPAPMAAFINLPQAAVLSLSPEQFLKVENGVVTTKPIKGTRPRHHNKALDQQAADELLASEKDRAENLMIVDLLRNDLSKSCVPGSVKTPSLFKLESFSNVHHLVTTITGKLAPNQHPLDLFKNCFPGGSITGAPKRRTMEIIDALEPCHRGIYCGSIAYCDVRQKMDSSITIRTLQCDRHHVYCHGGGGIVSDSQLEDEYKESQIKIANLLTW